MENSCLPEAAGLRSVPELVTACEDQSLLLRQIDELQ